MSEPEFKIYLVCKCGWRTEKSPKGHNPRKCPKCEKMLLEKAVME